MFRCVTEIRFEQVQKNGDGRNKSFVFDFVNEFEANDSWVDLTNQCNITFPKNIYVRDANNNLFPLGGTTTDKQLKNLFQRGDKVTVSFGYVYYESGNEIVDVSQIFTGYISLVTSKKPIVLECEDNMWLLKQIPCKPQTWSKDKTVEDLMKSLLSGTNFTVNALTKTTVGDLVIQNESVAQLLARLRHDFHLESYFSGNELRIGSQVYIESEAKTHYFVFQKNIISDDLEYQLKDDVKLSVVCESINTKQSQQRNKKGQYKTQDERLSVLVYYDSDGIARYEEKKAGKDFPPNLEGERRKLFFPNVTSAATLAQYGIDEMKKFYYSGFKGKFTTFAIPFVKMGDNVKIHDPLLPDRDGTYKVKGVKYTGGIFGHRQIIELHYIMK